MAWKITFKIHHSIYRKEIAQDVDVQPAKLFRVVRIKPVKGNPHWEKRILRDLGLFEVSFSATSYSACSQLKILINSRVTV